MGKKNKSKNGKKKGAASSSSSGDGRGAGMTGQRPAADAIIARGARASVVIFKHPRTPIPDRYRCFMHTQINVILTAGSAGPDANALGMIIMANSVTVASAYALNYAIGTVGAFGGNVPAGIRYLLGTIGTAGASNGLYGNFLVHASEIDAEITNGGVSPIGTNVVLAAYLNTGAAATPGMASQTLGEQPWSITGQTPDGAQTGMPLRMRSFIRMRDLFGGKLVDMTGPTQGNTGVLWAGTATAPPIQQVWWELRMSNSDISTTTRITIVKLKVSYDVEFYNRNPLTTVAPSVVEPDTPKSDLEEQQYASAAAAPPRR